MYNTYIYIHHTGQITSTPDNARISVGQNLTIVCVGSGGVIPSLLINGVPTDSNDQVISGSPGGTTTFYFIFATPANNGIEFTCTGTTGSIILDALCK